MAPPTHQHRASNIASVLLGLFTMLVAYHAAGFDEHWQAAWAAAWAIGSSLWWMVFGLVPSKSREPYEVAEIASLLALLVLPVALSQLIVNILFVYGLGSVASRLENMTSGVSLLSLWHGLWAVVWACALVFGPGVYRDMADEARHEEHRREARREEAQPRSTLAPPPAEGRTILLVSNDTETTDDARH